MPRRIVVTATVILLAATTPALAADPAQEPGPPAAPVPAGSGFKSTVPAGHRAVGPRVTEALRIARMFWEARPHGCSKGITVFDAMLPNEFGGLTLPAAPCAMWIGHGFFTGHHADDRVATCDQIVRLYGALVGARRSWHPRAIMNPATSATVWGCNHRFQPRAVSDAAPSAWATR